MPDSISERVEDSLGLCAPERRSINFKPKIHALRMRNADRTYCRNRSFRRRSHGVKTSRDKGGFASADPGEPRCAFDVWREASSKGQWIAEVSLIAFECKVDEMIERQLTSLFAVVFWRRESRRGRTSGRSYTGGAATEISAETSLVALHSEAIVFNTPSRASPFSSARAARFRRSSQTGPSSRDESCGTAAITRSNFDIPRACVSE